MIARSGFWKRRVGITSVSQLISRPVGNSNTFFSQIAREFSNRENPRQPSSSPTGGKSFLKLNEEDIPPAPQKERNYTYGNREVFRASDQTVKSMKSLGRFASVYLAVLPTVTLTSMAWVFLDPTFYPLLTMGIVGVGTMLTARYAVYSKVIAERSVMKITLHEDQEFVDLVIGCEATEIKNVPVAGISGETAAGGMGEVQAAFSLPEISMEGLKTPRAGKEAFSKILIGAAESVEFKDFIENKDLLEDIVTGKAEEVKKYTYVPK